MSPDDNEEYIEASRVMRLGLVGFILLAAVAAYFLVGEIERITPPENASLDEIRHSIEAFKTLNDIFLIVMVLQSLLFSAFLARLAFKTRQTGRFPPPGTAVIKRTRIVRGSKARSNARRTYLLAVLIWILVAAPVYIKWLLGEFG